MNDSLTFDLYKLIWNSWLSGKRSGIFQLESFTNIDEEIKIGDHQQSPSDSGTEISDDEDIKYSFFYVVSDYTWWWNT